jgi:ADP-ribose pyrophosphatase YjhB (NUDIX family)
MSISAEINYCPICGNAIIQETRFGKVRPVCPKCGWIYFADPKVAAAVLIEQVTTNASHGRVLLVRRVNQPFRGKWTLPAGFVDADEDPARAAERECLEETGLSVRVTGVMDVIAGLEHPRGANIIIVYHAEILSGQLAAHDDVDQAAFFPPDKLPPLAFEATKRIFERLRDERA